MFIPFCLNIVSNYLCKYRAEKLLKFPYEPLPDVVHTYIYKTPFILPDVLLFFSIIYCLNNGVFTKLNLQALYKSLCLRPIFSLCTTLPTCVENKPCKNVYSKIFLSTHDLMFSGHTCIFLFLGNSVNSIIIKYLFPLTLITSRQHYTIDVLTSFFIYKSLTLYN